MPQPDSNTELSVERTRLSYERTLMSWIRTATSLITFGFTIYKFFQIELARGTSRSEHVVAPTVFAVSMILIGLVSLVMATLEHRRDVNALNAKYPGGRLSLARVLAALISLLGLLALAIVVFRQ